MGLPNIVLDFDGVIHSYTSGWKGPRVITDPVVPGAMEFLYEMSEHYQIAISSSRSHYFGGRRAMKKYIKKNLYKYVVELNLNSDIGREYLHSSSMEATYLFNVHIQDELNKIMKKISFPKYKPPAILTIDDRAITFKGKWPTLNQIKNFKTWNK